jgi:D-amino-acid dehydrogenase
MSTESARHAVVVGAGIVGICCAIELKRRGLAVTVIDRLDPGEACSYGNAGILAAQAVVPIAMPGLIGQVPRMLLDPDSPLAVRPRALPKTLPWLWHFYRATDPAKVTRTADAMKALYGTTVELHEQLAREAGVPELVVTTRYLYVARDPRKVDTQNDFAWRLRRERGGEIEVFDGPALREIEPELSPLYTRGVRLGPMARTTNPFRLTRAYAELLRRLGGSIVRAEVNALRPAGGRVGLETSGGAYDADLAIVAAGAWSLSLLEPLGLKLPLIAERGYHMTFVDPGITLNHAVSELERHFTVSNMEMGLRLAGTEELGSADDPPTWRRAAVLQRLGQEMFPNLDVSKGTPWSGPRPGIPDSLPAIGPLADHPNIFVACGHGHLGLTGAPNTGRIIGALAAGERLNLDLAPYAADRFAARAAS